MVALFFSYGVAQAEPRFEQMVYFEGGLGVGFMYDMPSEADVGPDVDKTPGLSLLFTAGYQYQFLDQFTLGGEFVAGLFGQTIYGA